MTTQPQTTSQRNEKAILDAALAIMARQLGGPVRFAAVLDPGTTSIEIIFRPPSPEKEGGYIGAGRSWGPAPGETHERHCDLADGGFDKETLDRIICDIREEFDIMRSNA